MPLIWPEKRKYNINYPPVKNSYQPPRIQNLGNTCYANSVYQSLLALPGFRKECEKYQNLPIRRQFQIMNNFNRENYYGHKPNDLFSIVREKNSKFKIGQQNDSREFLSCLLSLLDAELTGNIHPDDSSSITSLFDGSVRYKCECKAKDYEKFKILSFPLSKNKIEENLEELLLQKRFCAVCELAKCTVQLKKPPPVWIIHLDRYSDGLKNQIPIIFPKTLQDKYQLYAVITQHGSTLSSGHYSAYINDGSNYWYCCSDINVYQLREFEIEGDVSLLFYVSQNEKNEYFPSKSTSLEKIEIS